MLVAVALLAGSGALAIFLSAKDALSESGADRPLYLLDYSLEILLNAQGSEPILARVRPLDDQIDRVRHLAAVEAVGTASFRKANVEVGDMRRVVRLARLDYQAARLLRLWDAPLGEPFVVVPPGSLLLAEELQTLRVDGVGYPLVRPWQEWPNFFPGRDRSPVDLWLVDAAMESGRQTTLVRLRSGVSVAAALRQLKDVDAHDWRLDEPLKVETEHNRLLLGWLGWTCMLALALCVLGVIVTELHRAQEEEYAHRIRLALGARPGGIAFEHWIEFCVVAVLALVLVAPVCLLAARPLGSLASLALGRPGLADAGFVLTWFAAVGMCAVLAALVAALPAAYVHARLSKVFASNRTLVISRFSRGSRGAIPVFLVCACFLLLGVAGNAIHTLSVLQAPELGYDSDGVLAIGLSVPDGTSRELRNARLEEIVEWAMTLPGVEQAALATSVPWASSVPTRISGDTDRVLLVIGVSENYFRLFGIPFRSIEEPASAMWTSGGEVVWLSPSARRAGGLGDGRVSLDEARISGEVGDVAGDPFGRFSLNAVYKPIQMTEVSSFYLLIKGSDHLALRAVAERHAGWLTDRALLEGITTSDDTWLGVSARVRLVAASGYALALLAGLLVLTNVHALMGLVLAERREELFIRHACGASPRALGMTVAKVGTKFVFTGIVLGVLATMAAVRWLAAATSALVPMGPAWYVICTMLIMLAAAAAATPSVRTAMRGAISRYD